MKYQDIKTLTDITAYAQVLEAESSAGIKLHEELIGDLLLEGEVDICSYHLDRNLRMLTADVKDCQTFVKKHLPAWEKVAADDKKYPAENHRVMYKFRKYTGDDIEKTRARVRHYRSLLRRLHKEYATGDYEVIQSRLKEFNEYYARFKEVEKTCASAVARGDWVGASKAYYSFSFTRYPKFKHNEHKSFARVSAGYREAADWHDKMAEEILPETARLEGRAELARERAAAARPEVLAELKEITALVGDTQSASPQQYSQAVAAINRLLHLRKHLDIMCDNLEIVASHDKPQNKNSQENAGRD